MQGIVLAQKTNSPRKVAETVFTPAFYAPYEQAARAALALICDARALLGAQGGVRAVTYRLKTPASIRGKLQKRGLPVTAASAATLHDIVGLRAVLSDVGQIYRFARLLIASPSAEFLCARDYIASPKTSGYRSLHLILRLPCDGARRVPVEIQLRTAPMDVWATLEHDACYKPSSARE